MEVRPCHVLLVLMELFVGDIVKQVMRTKLGKSTQLNTNIEAETIAKLTM